MIYVIHVCKNSKLSLKDPNYCDRAWVDEDLYDAKAPVTRKYCSECVKKGFKNTKKREYKMSPEKIEAFKQRMAEYKRKNKNEQT